MPPPFKRHVFVCTNRRPDGHSKGCCASKGSEAIRDYLKAEMARRGIKSECRANAAGCLDACEAGVSVVVYPEGTWYGRVTLADVDELIEKHLIGGQIVERLLMPPIVRTKKQP